jgi:hypothetical protein
VNVSVEGIPVFGKRAPFAGHLWNEGLGRSVVGGGGSSSSVARTGDSGCPLNAEEGNVVRMRTQKAHAPHTSV